MAVSPVMDLPVRWLVPPHFFFSPRPRRRALGSLLFNRPHSGVIVEEEVSECISVTSKPMWLRGHLHVLSDVECSITLVGSTSAWFGCLMRCTNGKISLKIEADESLSRSSLVIFFWLFLQPR